MLARKFRNFGFNV